MDLGQYSGLLEKSVEDYYLKLDEADRKYLSFLKKEVKFAGLKPRIHVIVPNEEKYVTLYLSIIGEIPYRYEKGGYNVRHGMAQVITTKTGHEKTPLSNIEDRDIYGCGRHALFAIHLSDLIFMADTTGVVSKKGYMETLVRVYSISEIDLENKRVRLTPIKYTGKHRPLLAVAYKANHLQCKKAYYYRVKEKES